MPNMWTNAWNWMRGRGGTSEEPSPAEPIVELVDPAPYQERIRALEERLLDATDAEEWLKTKSGVQLAEAHTRELALKSQIVEAGRAADDWVRIAAQDSKDAQAREEALKQQVADLAKARDEALRYYVKALADASDLAESRRIVMTSAQAEAADLTEQIGTLRNYAQVDKNTIATLTQERDWAVLEHLKAKADAMVRVAGAEQRTEVAEAQVSVLTQNVANLEAMVGAQEEALRTARDTSHLARAEAAEQRNEDLDARVRRAIRGGKHRAAVLNAELEKAAQVQRTDPHRWIVR